MFDDILQIKFWFRFLLNDAIHNVDYSVARYPSVCHMPVLCRKG